MCVQCGIGRLKDGVLKSFVEHVHFSIWRYMRSNKRKRRGGGWANIIYDKLAGASLVYLRETIGLFVLNRNMYRPVT